MTSKERVIRTQELRRSNAATPQDSRPNRERTRATVKAAEIKESNT
jgi:hypothetical protein